MIRSILPSERSLEGRRAFHHYNYGETQRGGTGGVGATSESKPPDFPHPRRIRPQGHLCNRLMTRRIEGLPEQESDALLEALFDHSEKPEFVYRHVWKVGDLLLWDNRCSTHARDDFPSDQRRLMSAAHGQRDGAAVLVLDASAHTTESRSVFGQSTSRRRTTLRCCAR